MCWHEFMNDLYFCTYDHFAQSNSLRQFFAAEMVIIRHLGTFLEKDTYHQVLSKLLIRFCNVWKYHIIIDRYVIILRYSEGLNIAYLFMIDRCFKENNRCQWSLKVAKKVKVSSAFELHNCFFSYLHLGVTLSHLFS